MNNHMVQFTSYVTILTVLFGMMPSLTQAQTATPSVVSVSGVPACSDGNYSPTLNWTGTPGSAGFWIDVSLDNTFNTQFWQKQVNAYVQGSHSTSAPSGFMVYDVPTGNLLSSPPLNFQPNITYYVRAIGGSKAVPLFGSVTSFNIPSCSNNPNTSGNPPSTVTVHGLPACTSSSYTPTFSWSGHPGDFGFYLDVSLNNTFSVQFWHKNISSSSAGSHSTTGPVGFTVYDAVTGGSPATPVLSFNPNTTYFVRAVNGSFGQPKFGQSSSFSVPSCNSPANPSVPVVSQPTNTESHLSAPNVINLPVCASGPYNAQVNWTGTRNSSFGYYLDLSTSPQFVSFWNKNITQIMATNQTNIPDGFAPYLGYSTNAVLNPDVTYYVRAYNGVHGPTSSFKVPSCGAAPNVPKVNTYKPIGHFDGISPDGYLVGWALDQGRPYDQIELHAYFGGLPGAAVKGVPGIMAKEPRADVNQVIGVPGNHGFYFPIPDELKNGKTYEVYMFAIDTDDSTGASNVLIANSPRAFNITSSVPSVPPMLFDTNSNEFVLNDKTAMDPQYGKGIWLGNKRIKVYRNVHGSNWLPAVYAGKNLNSAFTLDPLDTLMPTYSGSGVIYINNGNSVWSNNPYQMPTNEEKFESRVGLGYTKQSLKNNGLDFQMTYFVPSYDVNDPVIIQMVQATHTGSDTKNYSFVSYQNISTNGSASFDSTNNALVYQASTSKDSWNNTKPSTQSLFLTATEKITSYDVNASSFLGGGTEANPAGVFRGHLNNSLSGSDAIMAAQINLTFKPNETKTFAFVLGSYKGGSEKNSLIKKYDNYSAAQQSLNSTKQFYLNKTVHIPGITSRDAQTQTQLRLLASSAISTSLWWDNFVDGFTLNQMSRYLYDVNARDTAQISLGLNYLDPQLARNGLETYIKSQQFTNGKMPYGMDSGLSRGSLTQPDWGSDNNAWMALAVCENIKVSGDSSWLNKILTYRDDVTTDTVYNHMLKALNYDYNRLHYNGLVDTMGGDWLDQVHGSKLEHGESIYASSLLYNATVTCLPYMNSEDKKFYSGRAATIKNAIESQGFDAATGRYVRFISTDGQTRVGSSQDNKVFSDLGMLALQPGLDSQRLINTLTAAYNTNSVSGGKGNLVYTPSYSSTDHSLGGYTIPSWAYDNKVWGRVCAVVSVGLKRVGLSSQAEDNFAKCLPNKQDPKYNSPFNYLEYTDPRGNVVMPGEDGKTIGLVGFSSAVDDSMNIWAQAQLASPNPDSNLQPLAYPDGTLIQIGHNIYVIEHGLKRLIASWEVFNGLGYKISNVVKVSSTLHSDGQPLYTWQQRHVRGTLVIDGNGVGWFLGQNNRQPFPSYEILQSWGGTLAQLIPMNSFDSQLPIGSVVQMKP